MAWHDFLRCFMSVDVLKAHHGWCVNGVHSMQLHRAEFHPRQVGEEIKHKAASWLGSWFGRLWLYR